MPRKKSQPNQPVEDEEEPGGFVVEGVDADIQRVSTGLYSLDMALGGGLPLRSFMEISGYEGSGKSSLSYYLLGAVSSPKSGIAIGDNEGLDPNYAARSAGRAGWSGTLKVVPYVNRKFEPTSEEEMLDILANYIVDPSVRSLLLDSIGGISPTGEEEGSVADANMGKRAQITGRFLRKAVHRLRHTPEPKVLIATNHIHQIIGGQGTMTSGGKAVHYLASTRIRLQADKDDGFWVVKGKIVKRRYHGFKPIENFQVVLIPGEGIHKGLSAVQDCLMFGLAVLDRTIRLGGVSYGYFKNMVENRNDSSLFVHFVKTLEALKNERAYVGPGEADREGRSSEAVLEAGPAV